MCTFFIIGISTQKVWHLDRFCVKHMWEDKTTRSLFCCFYCIDLYSGQEEKGEHTDVYLTVSLYTPDNQRFVLST